MNNLKQTDVQPVYLFPTGGRGLELANHISLIQYITLLQKLLDMDFPCKMAFGIPRIS